MERKLVEHDAQTGEIVERNMSEDEIAELQAQPKPNGDITT